MKPSFTNARKNGDNFYFTLSNVNVSVANAIRRTILSDIQTVVFRTFPHEHDDCVITENISRFNNEIIKQRLSCIPIHLKQVDKDLIKDYFVEVNVENITDTIIYVTTEDFKVKRKDGANTTNEIMKSANLFPADPYTGHFIDIVRLRPRISEQIPGDKIAFTCDFSIGTARENGMFNVVSTCSFAGSLDEEKINSELGKKKQIWKDEGKSDHEIEYEKKNWLLLDSKRIVIPNSFDFIIQSVGVFDNEEILSKALNVLIQKLRLILTQIENDTLSIVPSKTTMENSYDIVLQNEDYTLGKALEYILFQQFFDVKDPTLSFCGFIKLHPFDKDSIIRVALISEGDKNVVKQMIQSGVQELIQIFEAIDSRVK